MLKDTGPFDIIGDVHGCYSECRQLLSRLGYRAHPNHGYHMVHPEGRKIVFVGDLVDRGPDSVDVLRMVMHTVKAGDGYAVLGNHDDKLLRFLGGKPVALTGGLETTVAELVIVPQDEKEAFKQFLASLPYYLPLDDYRLIIAHAGIKEADIGQYSERIRTFCLYAVEGKVERDQDGKVIRVPWAKDYQGAPLIVYGHTPVREAVFVNNTINLDTGCVYGNKISALRYPENQVVSLPALKDYVGKTL